MKRWFIVALLIASARPCTLAPNYFYKVTALRGQVVGVQGGDWRHPIPSLRHKVVRPNVTIGLYKYNELRSMQEPPLKIVHSDEKGRFDFGTLREGRYFVRFDDSHHFEDGFNVEIQPAAPATHSILVDISPIYPSCKGGHEFLIR